jgi:uncharacterized OB-fold protein
MANPSSKTKPVPEYRGPLPQATPETKPFWDGLRQQKLMVQRCKNKKCGKAYFYPRPWCPQCQSWDVEWFEATGKGKLYSFNINYRPPPYMGTDPIVIAVVELAEGPRILSNLVDVEPDPNLIHCDMPVEILYQKMSDEVTLPKFRPAKGR